VEAKNLFFAMNISMLLFAPVLFRLPPYRTPLPPLRQGIKAAVQGAAGQRMAGPIETVTDDEVKKK
jgi:hypothetical protein